MKELKGQKTKVFWSFFADFKSAFDKVDHECLFKKMKNLGVDPKLNRTI